MSEEPHIRAYLCDECWNRIPHFKVGKVPTKKVTLDSPMGDWPMLWIALYTTSCMVLIAIIGYYLWLKQNQRNALTVKSLEMNYIWAAGYMSIPALNVRVEWRLNIEI